VKEGLNSFEEINSQHNIISTRREDDSKKEEKEDDFFKEDVDKNLIMEPPVSIYLVMIMMLTRFVLGLFDEISDILYYETVAITD